MHNYLRILRISLAFFAACVAVLISTPSLASNVDCNEDPDALGLALAGASPGDTLKVHGICLGTVTIAVDLTVEGKNNATLDGDGAGPVVTVLPGVTAMLKKLTITGGVASDPNSTAGGIVNNGHLTLEKTTVTGKQYGSPLRHRRYLERGGDARRRGFAHAH